MSKILWMPPRPRKVVRMTAVEYRALYKSVEPRGDDILEISDEESRVGDTQEKDMHEEEAPSALADNPRMGWTEELYFKDPEADAFFHDLLVKTLENYYPDLQATLEYRSTEHRHPLMSSYWDTELWIKSVANNKKARKVESIHTTRVSRATVERSMADAAYNALVYYRGRRFGAMQYDGLRYYPRYLPDEDTWTIEVADASTPTLQAQVELTRELANKVVSLEEELLNEKNLNKQERAVSNGLRAELGRPKLHERIRTPLIKKDSAP